LVSARTLVHALRGDATSRGAAQEPDQGDSDDGSAVSDEGFNEGATGGPGEGCARRVLSQVLESRDGDPSGAWILHVRFFIILK
jgi:hypothetical protein